MKTIHIRDSLVKMFKNSYGRFFIIAESGWTDKLLYTIRNVSAMMNTENYQADEITIYALIHDLVLEEKIYLSDNCTPIITTKCIEYAKTHSQYVIIDSEDK